MNKINPLYIINGKQIIVFDKFLKNKVYQNLNLEIYNKFISNFSNKILTKQLPIKNCQINKIYFLYPYSIGYGYPKTNISQLLEIAKLGNKKYCNYIFKNYLEIIIPNIIKNYDVVVFVPPSISRQCNILNLIKKQVHKLGKKIIYSYKKEVGPQIKTIKNLEEKIKTANTKFNIGKVDKGVNKILIIDDVVNTGASICSIAEKIKLKNKNAIIDGFCLIGSLDNEMIKEI